jgi:inner membrane protein
MDNITHSLIGVVLGNLIVHCAPKFSESPKSKRIILWTCILSNNAPDIDVVIPSILGGGRLTALLEHRGFTHTVTAAPFLGLVCLALAWLLSDRPKPADFRSLLSPGRVWGKLFAISILGVLCHLAADFCNDYGVHPFSPFGNRWFYGDFIFIVEPLIWFSILPLAFQESKAIVLKVLVVFLGVSMAGVLIWGPFVPSYIAVSSLIWAGIAILWQWRAGRGKRSWIPSISLVALVLVVFFSASQSVHSDLIQLIDENAHGEKIVQLAQTPAPADPFCWKFLIVTEGPADRYMIRAGVLSLFPKQIRSESCQWGLNSSYNVSLAPISLPSRTARDEEISWKGQYEGKRSEIGLLDSQYCQFKALRRFARAPFWIADQESWIAGDLRYDRKGGGGFAGIHFSRPDHATSQSASRAQSDTPCPSYIPPWDPPVPE